MINISHRQRYLRLPLDSNLTVFDFEQQIFPYWHVRKFPPDGLPIPVTYRHHHEEVELFCVVEGKMDAYVNGEHRTMCAGDLFIANPFDIHAGSINRPDRFANNYVILDLRHFGSLCGSAAEAQLSGVQTGVLAFPRYINSGEPGADALAEAILSVCLSNRSRTDDPNPTAADCRTAGGICELLSILLTYFPPIPVTEKHRRNAVFIQTVADYVGRYYTSELSTTSICNALGYNISYFCKRFKESFGTTFTDYLNTYRIHIATGVYHFSTLPLSEIAAKVGYNDYCYFSRVFRQNMGMSPSEFYGR